MNGNTRICHDQAIIPVDLGVRNLATTIENGAVMFYGAEVDRIRRKYPAQYPWCSAGTCLEKWSEADRKETRRRAREAARQIIAAAKSTNAVIAIGNPRTSRQPRKWGAWSRTYWPIMSFTQYLKAKARALGLRVLDVPESYTSQTCSRCGARGFRRATVFICLSCKLSMNSDENAALNIGERARVILARARQPSPSTARPPRIIQRPAQVAVQVSCVVCTNVH